MSHESAWNARSVELRKRQQILPPVRQRAPPLLRGPGPQDVAGQSLVPEAHPGPFVGSPAAKQRRAHAPEDLASPLPHGLQPPLDLRRQRLRQLPIHQRLFQRLQGALCASLLALESRARLLEATRLDVVLPRLPGVVESPVVCARVGHGWRLRGVAAPGGRLEETMTHFFCRFQHVHAL
jgi:hypothetical protein